MNHREVSEIITGLVIKDRVNANSFPHYMFYPPYNDMMKIRQDTGDREEMFLVSSDAFNNALYAQQEINGAVDVIDWVEKLGRFYNYELTADLYEREIKNLRNGKEPNWNKITEFTNKARNGEVSKFSLMSDITSSEIPFLKTGVEAIDKYLGGVSAVGITLVAAEPKVGKTFFALDLGLNFIKEHTKKFLAIFTLEMIDTQLRARADLLEKETSLYERVWVCDENINSDEIIAYASGIEDLGMIIIDFADLMSDGEITEPAMTKIYRTLMAGSKLLRVPILLLAQFSGGYQGGIPHYRNIRYTRLAEAFASQVWTLYRPSVDYNYNPTQGLPDPLGKQTGFLIAWLSRYGIPEQEVKTIELPGAILIPFLGRKGWDLNTKGRWFELHK